MLLFLELLVLAALESNIPSVNFAVKQAEHGIFPAIFGVTG